MSSCFFVLHFFCYHVSHKSSVPCTTQSLSVQQALRYTAPLHRHSGALKITLSAYNHYMYMRIDTFFSGIAYDICPGLYAVKNLRKHDIYSALTKQLCGFLWICHLHYLVYKIRVCALDYFP